MGVHDNLRHAWRIRVYGHIAHVHKARLISKAKIPKRKGSKHHAKLRESSVRSLGMHRSIWVLTMCVNWVPDAWVLVVYESSVYESSIFNIVHGPEWGPHLGKKDP